MSANPHANGGKLRKPLHLPDFCGYAVPIDKPGTKEISPTETLGKFFRDVMRRNMNTFRLFSPDENASNRLQDVYQASPKPGSLRSSQRTLTAQTSLPTGA